MFITCHKCIELVYFKYISKEFSTDKDDAEKIATSMNNEKLAIKLEKDLEVKNSAIEISRSEVTTIITIDSDSDDDIGHVDHMYRRENVIHDTDTLDVVRVVNLPSTFETINLPSASPAIRLPSSSEANDLQSIPDAILPTTSAANDLPSTFEASDLPSTFAGQYQQKN